MDRTNSEKRMENEQTHMEQENFTQKVLKNFVYFVPEKFTVETKNFLVSKIYS